MIEVGVRVPHALFAKGADSVAAFAADVDASGLDRVWVGDHVSFRGGQGYDGLLQATALAVLTRRVRVQTAVYLLALRSPLPVARQVATIAELAPDRFVFGVGVGGDDPAEVVNCGVDPSTLGRRMDESVAVVRRLLAGETVAQRGDHFALEGASIRPVPHPPVPVVVGGRAPAALRRAGCLGDGWLGVFVDPARFGASVETVEKSAADAGRHKMTWDHGVLVWCAFGATAEAARPALADAMQNLYQQPFERFERYAPHGTPEDVAAALVPYADAGAKHVLLAAVAADPLECVSGAARVRHLLRRTA